MKKAEYDLCINLIGRMVGSFNTMYGTMDALDIRGLELILGSIQETDAVCEMTIKEAMEILKSEDGLDIISPDANDAIKLAIHSLEAWDKVLKELHEEWTDSNTFRIIHKHLKEVEDEHTDSK